MQKPICLVCGNDRQVWINQLSGKYVCHRVGCHNEIKEAGKMKNKTVMELYERSCELQIELEEIQEEIDIRAAQFVQERREELYSSVHKLEIELDNLDPASVDYANAVDELRVIQWEINEREAGQ